MPRTTGIYKNHSVGGETVRAFVPAPLPPKKPAIVIDGTLGDKHIAAIIAMERLGVASTTVPSLTWFLYGFVRKEAVISSQIEGTQATLEDVA